MNNLRWTRVIYMSRHVHHAYHVYACLVISCSMSCPHAQNYLIRWCTTTYAEIFASWIHIKAIRLYVEAVLRYGLPVNLAFALMEPRKGQEKHVRELLQNLYAKLASANLTQALDANETDLSGFGSDFYPYVYLPLSLFD